MRRSIDRILTTHVGSLGRPLDLLEMMREKEHGRPYDADAYTERVTSAVADVVAEQVKAGLDVVTDGELGKVGFLTYVKDRLGGFDTSAGERLMPPSWQVEIDTFPEYYAGYLGKYKDRVSPMTTMVCTGPVTYQGHAPAADRHRQPARGARGPRRRRGLPAFHQPQRLRAQRVLRELRASTSRPWPRRCARSTSRSSTPGSCCRSTTRG